ncbi:MAG: hypothetical protein SPJ52_00775 [Candidatus Enterosoma sp.]|nr:hypothetical protein [bacterium]MDY5865674.1 hypothetical protein [Candidatus Enterosoma sp.]
MSLFKKTKRVLPVLATLLLLSSCSTSSDPVKYPSDYKDKIFDNSVINSDPNIIGNDWKHYYDDVIPSKSSIYTNLLTQMLVDVSTVAHNNDGTEGSGSDVTRIMKDFDNQAHSVYKDGEYSSSVTYDNVKERAKDKMFSTVTVDSANVKDNLFYESKFVSAQQLAYTLGGTFDDTKVSSQGVLVNPNTTYEDVFKAGDQYSYYLEKTYYNDLKIQYLTADYIYNKSYASIGNSTARKVQIVKLTDRTDNVGAAKRLLQAYVEDYISNPSSPLLGKDPEFKVLSKLWKGITSSFVDSIEGGAFSSRYDENTYLTSEEISWLKDKKLMTDTTSDLAIGKIMADKKKLDKMDIDNPANENPYSSYISELEDSYTEKYKLSIGVGLRNAVDKIVKDDYVTEGIYTSSDSIDSLPAALKNNIFSVNLALDKSTVDNMKNKKDKDGKDSDNYVSIDGVSIFQADGNRYIINNGSTSSDDNKIIYYDSENKAYYLVRILDAVSNASLSQSSTTSMYDSAKKKEQIAREVAFKLASSDTYKKEATIYYLRRLNIDYSDSDFLDYLKENYKDLFKTESTYDQEPKLYIPNK